MAPADASGGRGSPSGIPPSRISLVWAASVWGRGYCMKLGDRGDEAGARGRGRLAADTRRALRVCSEMGDSERVVVGDC